MVSSSKTENVTEAYSALVNSGAIEEDPAQRALALRLDALLVEVRAFLDTRSKSNALGWLLNRRRPTSHGPEGIYIHGKVGRGKSMLMDIFFDLLPHGRKRRVHFNAFMAEVHERIAGQRRDFAEGRTRERDPIKPVGRALAQEAKVLCFDEFSISDIADAMIVGRLFAVLFQEDTILVATSNVAPDDLYLEGLNRPLFLPFIDLLKAHCDVFQLESRTDFRLEKISRAEAYLSPLGPKSDATLKAVWKRLSDGHAADDTELIVKGRHFSPKHAAVNAAWFTFDQLCREPRGASDYLAIADRFETVIVEGVPMMDRGMRNEAKRFILLVDTLYDKGIRAIFTAQANPHALYQSSSGTEAFEFQRTASRLIEMQSEEYLNRVNALAGSPSSGRRDGQVTDTISHT
jgi:cell division protein ZapE